MKLPGNCALVLQLGKVADRIVGEEHVVESVTDRQRRRNVGEPPVERVIGAVADIEE